MREKHLWVSLLLLFFQSTLIMKAQNLQFSVVEFGPDPFDTSARDERFKKIDGSGSLYAIIKVTSETPSDDLRAYNFDFGNMNHRVDDSHDGELWLYVQKNAKTVTISRQGYNTLRRYDLRTTIEEGRNYKLVLSSQGPKVYMQWVQFTVKPADSQAFITITREGGDGQEESIGAVNAQGQKAKSLPYGTYNYKVISENYYASEGRFRLDNQDETHQEMVELRPRFSNITLRVDADADIFVNGEQKGRRTWTGPLNAGVYQVECRQTNYRPSTQTITVEEGQSRTFDLTSPTPITGTLSLSSDPLGASIKIDGRDYGVTPRNISNLLIGQHVLTLNYAGYNEAKKTIEIKEGEITEESLTLNNIPVNPDSKTFTVNGVSFVMKRVEGGTFQMGATSEQGGEAESDEKPVHSVTLSDYYIGETEVTQALWQAIMGTTVRQQRDKANTSWPIRGEGSNYPMYYVSYEDCQEFVRKLKAQTGMNFRLPTEAEWEYAARGGKKSRGYKYSGSSNLKEVAWCWENSGDQPLSGEWSKDKVLNNNCRTHPVKTKQANELGIYDMSGNVYEWCQDWYGSYSSSAQTNPTGPAAGSKRVLRCGGWGDDPRFCRVSDRSGSTPSNRNGSLGLRLAQDDITLTVQTPTTVEAGDQFRIRFTVNSQNVSNFTAPDFKGFEVIYGPSTSRQSSSQMVNGQPSPSTSITYTYVLICSKPGTYTINPATIQSGSAVVESKPLTIQVRKPD